MRILIFLFFSATVYAQDLPSTNIYLFDFQQGSDSIFALSNPRYLTADNARGYNNQPAFVGNNRLLMASAVPGQRQPDVYELDLTTNRKTRITRTDDGEYSPTPMPNGFQFSAVRVEMDGQLTQRLWKFPLNRSDNGRPIFDVLRGVGYHAWLDRNRVAMFVVGDPHYLVVGDVNDGSTRHLAVNIGRGMQVNPAGNLVYVDKATPNTWFLKELNRETLQAQTLGSTVRGSEDLAILPDGSILMAKNAKLYRMRRGTDYFGEIADFSRFGLTNITRIAVRGNRIALVNAG